jgi:ketosteroid isomerase-like protein
MTRNLIILILLTGLVQAQESVILEREAAFRKAMIAADQTAFKALLASDFVGVWGDGKQHKLAGKVNGVDIERIVPSEVEVRLYNGDTAVVTGAWQLSGSGQTKKVHFTHVWVKQGAEWKLVSRHLS